MYDETKHIVTGIIHTSVSDIEGKSIKFRTAPDKVVIPYGDYYHFERVDDIMLPNSISIREENSVINLSNMIGGKDHSYISGQFVNENIGKSGAGSDKACYVGDDYNLKYFNITHCVYDETKHIVTGIIHTSVSDIEGKSIKFRTAPDPTIVIPSAIYTGTLKVDGQALAININVVSELDTMISRDKIVGSYLITGQFINENISISSAADNSTCFVGSVEDNNNIFHWWIEKTVININSCRYVNGTFTGTIKLKDPIFNMTDIIFK